uniref:SOCS box domain-containing protein n=1 Tax=Arion vulgaris TaxID=1028688 RepID=A0A0B6YTC1_9EUPU
MMAMIDTQDLSEYIDALHLENGGDIDMIFKSRLVVETLANTQISCLSLACRIHNLRLVTTLLEQGADVNIVEEDGMSPLHILCNSEKHNLVRIKIAQLLLQHKIDVNLQDFLGRTALLLACHNNQVGLVDLLIQAGCDVNIPDKNGDAPFMVACRMASDGWYFWNTDCLIDDDSDDKEEDEDSDNCGQDNKFPPVVICKLLLRAGANPRMATLLPPAVLFSTMETVKEFIDLGMDVNLMDENRRSPLGCACTASHIPHSMVKLLLERGADVNEDGGGRKSKPIILAYVYNSVDKIRLLLSYGATISCEEMSDLVSISLSKWFLENPEIIHEESRELLSWKLLLKAGFRPRLPLLTMKLKRVSLCSSYSKVSPWIHNLLSPMLSLADICRVTIRSQLHPSIDVNIDYLPLPNTLKGFLKYNEFTTAVFRRNSSK